MSCMKLGSKADLFQRKGQTWFCTTGLPSDITVEIEETTFHLHKFPLLSMSGALAKLITEKSDEGGEGYAVQLHNVPGGAKAFELVAKFCYGVKLELTAANIVYLHSAAEHLEMTEEIAERNLVSLTEIFLNEVVLNNWKDSIKALQTCGALPQAEDLQIVKRCIESVASKACNGTNLLGWPMLEQGPMWNGISTGTSSRPMDSAMNWWYDDASSLSLPIFKRLVSALMESRGVSQDTISSSLISYAKRNPEVIEEIDRLLPMQKGIASTKILFGFLQSATMLQARPSCILNLERRIGLQLDQATLEDLLVPDVECVQRILEHFLAMDEETGGASPCFVEDEEQFTGSSSLTPITTVAKLIDGYLAEIAPDTDLKLTKFQSLASAVPDYARPIDDGLYRAIDVYLKAHPLATEGEREELYRAIDFRKLSVEAIAHAAQNEILPVRALVQVIFSEQLQLRSSITGCLSMSENLIDEPRPMTGKSQLLKVGMDSVRMRVSELEEECSNMRSEIEKLVVGQPRPRKEWFRRIFLGFGLPLLCSTRDGLVREKRDDSGKRHLRSSRNSWSVD